MNKAKKGKRIENEVRKDLEAWGMEAFRTPGSGNFGTRNNIKGLKGDVRAWVRGNAEECFNIEVKARKEPPKTMLKWLQGNDILVIRPDNAESVYMLTKDTMKRLITAYVECHDPQKTIQE